MAVTVQQFSVDRPRSSQRAHSHRHRHTGDWLPRKPQLSLWLASGEPASGSLWIEYLATHGKIGRRPPRNCLMIGCGSGGVRRAPSYRCSQRRLADGVACWLALRRAAIHKPPGGHTSTSPVVCACALACISSITFPAGRCATKPCQRALTPHYSKPGRKWVFGDL